MLFSQNMFQNVVFGMTCLPRLGGCLWVSLGVVVCGRRARAAGASVYTEVTSGRESCTVYSIQGVQCTDIDEHLPAAGKARHVTLCQVTDPSSQLLSRHRHRAPLSQHHQTKHIHTRKYTVLSFEIGRGFLFLRVI